VELLAKQLQRDIEAREQKKAAEAREWHVAKASILMKDAIAQYRQREETDRREALQDHLEHFHDQRDAADFVAAHDERARMRHLVQRFGSRR
jgi:hypothetical protein